MSDDPYSIRSVQRVCDILDLLQRSAGGVTLVEVAKVTGLPKSSAFRYLATLESRRYVERDPSSGDFTIGLALLPLQARQMDLLAKRAQPHLDTLRNQFKETVNLGLLDGNRVIYLEIAESPRAIRNAPRKGDREYIHSTALGKAVAATLPEERVRAILLHEGMPASTPATVTDPEAYLKVLERVREDGYAVDDRENESDGRCLAVAIPGMRLPVALSISAPASRLTMEEVPEAAVALQAVAGRLGSYFGGGGGPDGEAAPGTATVEEEEAV